MSVSPLETLTAATDRVFEIDHEYPCLLGAYAIDVVQRQDGTKVDRMVVSRPIATRGFVEMYRHENAFLQLRRATQRDTEARRHFIELVLQDEEFDPIGGELHIIDAGRLLSTTLLSRHTKPGKQLKIDFKELADFSRPIVENDQFGLKNDKFTARLAERMQTIVDSASEFIA